MQKTGRLTSLLILGSLVLMIQTGACSNQSIKPEVQVVMAPYFGSWVCNYGIINGIITSDKVDVTIEQSARFDDQMMAGNFPMGAMNTAAFAIATEMGNINFKALSIYLAHTGLESTAGVAVVYAPAGSPLASPQDLAGKTVGVPSLQSATTTTFLGLLDSLYGITADQITLIDSAPPQLIEFMRKGDIDAALLLGDPSVQTYYNTDFEVIWNIDQAFEAAYNTYNIASFLAVQEDYLEGNRDTVRAVYDLLVESQAYGEAHLDELAQTYVEEFGGDAEFYRNAYKNHYSVTFAPAGGAISEGIAAIFGFVRDAGVISAAPDLSDVFETW